MNKTNREKWAITVAVIIGTIMCALDTSIVNVALPHMQGNMGASVEEITWVATGYILSTVIIMPIIGMLSSRFGRKRFYLASIVLFTVASMLCGMAWDLTSIVVFRILQGMGGGAMIPIAQAILRETFPPEEQGMAMGLYGFGVVLGPAFGPTIGGWLTDHYSWPWIFYINVPVGIIDILMIMRFVHDPPYLTRDKGKIDFTGLAFMTVGLGALQIMLEKGEQKDWLQSGLIRYLAAVSLVGLILFVWRELVTDRPAVNLRMLKDINFTSGTLLGGMLGMGLYGSLFLLPMFLQQVLGYPAYDAGLALMPRSLAMALVMPFAGKFYNKLGPRILISFGLVVCSLSFYDLSRLSLAVGFWDIFVPQFLQGIGFGMIFVALSTAALSTIGKRSMTDAAGLYNVIRQVFGSVGIAVSATLLTSGEYWQRARLVEQVTVFRDTAAQWYNSLNAAMAHRGADPLTARDMTLRAMDGAVIRQAGMLAYNHVYLLLACLFIISLPLVLLLKEGKHDGDGEIMID